MRFQQVIQKVYGEPWAITPSGWYAIHSLVMAHIEDAAGVQAKIEALEAKRPAKGIFGEQLETMKIEKGVAVIPIKGSIVKGASLFEKSCGAVSHEDIHSDLDEAVAAGVRSIVLDMNTPGGMVMGTPEVAKKIAGMRGKGIDVFAWTDELIGSAGYFMAAGAREIYAAPSAMVGSVGTVWEWYNVVEALKARGIKYNIFTSGAFKGMGHPATELTDQQRLWIQTEVNRSAEAFKDHIRAYRNVDEEAMQGQVFDGDQAVGVGLIDGTIETLREVVELARSR